MGNTDSIKLWFTYLTAFLVALISLIGMVGVFIFVWITPQADTASPVQVALVMGPLGIAFGQATNFIFGSETATRTARATERAHEAGVIAGASTPMAPIGSPTEDPFLGDPEDGDLAATESTEAPTTPDNT